MIKLTILTLQLTGTLPKEIRYHHRISNKVRKPNRLKVKADTKILKRKIHVEIATMMNMMFIHMSIIHMKSCIIGGTENELW